MHKIITDYGSFDSSCAAVKVYVRLRPPYKEPARVSSFLHANNMNKIEIRDPQPGKHHQVIYSFNKIFWTETTQEDTFSTVMQPQIEHVIGGANACCFAYGQTGSGKTHTMFGPSFEDRGMIPRSVEYIFEKLAGTENTVAIGVSFLEIYNDTIRDLAKNYMLAKLNPDAEYSKETTSDMYENIERRRQDKFMAPDSDSYRQLQEELRNMNYEIQDDGKGNVSVKDLTILYTSSAEEIMSIIKFGLGLRATHGTKMNAGSSRSHTVVTIRIAQTIKKSNLTISGVLNLVDLAGNEKLKQSESTDNRLREAKHINSSLTALGKVVMALDPGASKQHIPYRESKLTRILQNSLSGNSYTVVVANIHPHPEYYEECLSTLEFVNRCRNVSNHPKVNLSVNIDAVTGGWTLTTPRHEKTFGNFDQQPMHRLISTSSKLFWRHRTSVELNLYEHSIGDLLELSGYNIDAKVDMGHVYLLKSPLLPEIEQLVAATVAQDQEEAKCLGIKYYPKDAAHMAVLRDKLLGEYVTTRTNLDIKEGGATLVLSVVPMKGDLTCADGKSPIVITEKPEGIAPITQLARVNATEKFDKTMQSFQNNGVIMIRKEIEKALNFEDISKKAMTSVMVRLNSQRLEEQLENGKTTENENKVPIVASPPPKKEIRRSSNTSYVHENRVMRQKQQPVSKTNGPADDIAVAKRVSNSHTYNPKNRRHSDVAKRPTNGSSIPLVKKALSGSSEESRLPTIVN